MVIKLNGDLMKGPYEVNVGENSSTLLCGCEILQVWNGVVIGNREAIECPVVPHGLQSPEDILGNMYKGELKLLDE